MKMILVLSFFFILLSFFFYMGYSQPNRKKREE